MENQNYKNRNIGGLYLDITANGLHEKIDLINQAIKHYQEAERLLEQAQKISVDVSVAGLPQSPVS